MSTAETPQQDIKTLADLYDGIDWRGSEEVLSQWHQEQGKMDKLGEGIKSSVRKFRCAMLEEALWGEDSYRMMWARYMLDRAGIWHQVAEAMISAGLAKDQDVLVPKTVPNSLPE